MAEIQLKKADGSNLFPKVDIQAIFDLVHPIGEIYIQYPGELTPMEVYNKNGIKSTWKYDYRNWEGVFFRAEGGNATSFNGKINTLTKQEESLPNITGSLAMRDAYGIDIFENPKGALSFAAGWDWYQGLQLQNNGHHEGTIIYFDAKSGNTIYGGKHVTPVNATIRIWKRVEPPV